MTPNTVSVMRDQTAIRQNLAVGKNCGPFDVLQSFRTSQKNVFKNIVLQGLLLIVTVHTCDTDNTCMGLYTDVIGLRSNWSDGCNFLPPGVIVVTETRWYF